MFLLKYSITHYSFHHTSKSNTVVGDSFKRRAQNTEMRRNRASIPSQNSVAATGKGAFCCEHATPICRMWTCRAGCRWCGHVENISSSSFLPGCAAAKVNVVGRGDIRKCGPSSRSAGPLTVCCICNEESTLALRTSHFHEMRTTRT